MMKSSVPTKRISRIFYVGDLRSGHFCDLPIISQCAKKSTPLYLLWRKLIWVESYRIGLLGTIRVKICIAYTSKWFEVTRVHQPSFANNYWSKRGRGVGLVSVRSSRPSESTDMQYDPFRSSRDLGLTWPEVKLWPWPFKVILYMVQRALTRQTSWYPNRFSTFKIKDCTVEKPFWNFFEFWPLATSISTWDKKWPKWFWNDFSRAFERCLSFFSTETRSRDHGGAFKRPPPPSRRWKIQRPSMAGCGLSGGHTYMTHGRRIAKRQCVVVCPTFIKISQELASLVTPTWCTAGALQKRQWVVVRPTFIAHVRTLCAL